MTSREESIFLYGWARRRREGQRVTLVRGLLIGAIGGLLFAGLMLFAMTQGGASFSINEDAAGPMLSGIAHALGPTLFLFVISIGAFAGLGVFVSIAIWRRMEWRYHALLEAGRHVPPDEPVLTAAEKRTKWIILGGFGLLCVVLIGFVLWEIQRGAL